MKLGDFYNDTLSKHTDKVELGTLVSLDDGSVAELYKYGHGDNYVALRGDYYITIRKCTNCEFFTEVDTDLCSECQYNLLDAIDEEKTIRELMHWGKL